MKLLPTISNVNYDREGNDFPCLFTIDDRKHFITNYLFDGADAETMFNKQNELGSLFNTTIDITPSINLLELQETHTEYSSWNVQDLANVNYLIVEYNGDYLFYFVTLSTIINANQVQFQAALDVATTYINDDLFDDKEVFTTRQFLDRKETLGNLTWDFRESSLLHNGEQVLDTELNLKLSRIDNITWYMKNNTDINNDANLLDWFNKTQWMIIYDASQFKETKWDDEDVFGIRYSGKDPFGDNFLEVPTKISFAPTLPVRINSSSYDFRKYWSAENLYKAYKQKVHYRGTWDPNTESGDYFFKDVQAITIVDQCPFTDIVPKELNFQWDANEGMPYWSNAEGIAQDEVNDNGSALCYSQVDYKGETGSTYQNIYQIVRKKYETEFSEQIPVTDILPNDSALSPTALKDYNNEPKLYIAPVSKYKLVNASDSPFEYSPDMFYNTTQVQVGSFADLVPEQNNQFHYINKGYYQFSQNNNYGLYMKNDFSLPFIDDKWNDYIQDHKNSLYREKDSVAAKGLTGVVTGTVAGAMMGGFVGGAVGFLGSTINWVNNHYQHKAKRQDLQEMPTSLRIGSSGLFGYNRTNLQTELQFHEPLSAEKKQISDFFHQYGYQIDAFYNLNQTYKSRYYFNYIEVINVGTVLNNNISSNQRKELIRLFAGGIRLWHYRDRNPYPNAQPFEVGNYEYDNTEVSFLE